MSEVGKVGGISKGLTRYPQSGGDKQGPHEISSKWGG